MRRRDVKRQRQPGVLDVLEEVLDHGMEEREVGADLAHALAAVVAVEPQHVAQRGIRGVRDRPGIDVAEGDEPVRIFFRDLDNVFHRLDAVTALRIDHGKEDRPLHADLFIPLKKLLRRGKIILAAALRTVKPAGVNVNINEHRLLSKTYSLILQPL